jgi:hypothetical protein
MKAEKSVDLWVFLMVGMMAVPTVEMMDVQ